MAYELANYWGGVASPAQLAALAKARAAKKAGKLGYDNPIGPNYPPFEYSGEVMDNKRKCRPPKKNPNRSKYMACKLSTLQQIPCEYRTKENIKALTPWAAAYCPSKQRKKGISSAMAQVKKTAKAAGIQVTRVKANGKRAAKSKAMLLEELRNAGVNDV